MNMGVAIVLAVLGVTSALYGLSLVLSASKVRFHYAWFFFAILLVAPAFLMALGLWDKIPLALHGVVVAALVVFAACEIIIGAAIVRHYSDQGEQGLDWLVVLGAQILEGKPGRTFTCRLDAAYDYLLANPCTRCIVCGAQGTNESVPESHAGRDYLIERGIDSARIQIEDSSFSTVQNIRNAAKLVDRERDAVGIVTNNYHVARSLAIARKAGLGHVVGIAVKSHSGLRLSSVVRESFAWAKDVLSGKA